MLPAKVQALCDHLGEAGKELTAKGQLKLADGRALVDILDTGDQIDPTIGDTTVKTHTTASLRQLMYFVMVAEASGAVRCCASNSSAATTPRMLEFFWRHPAPETSAVLDVLGRHLPDPTLAKQARKATIKHRSWMANVNR